MKKTYFITLHRVKSGQVQEKSLFYHKPLCMSLRKMIAELYEKYPEWSFKDIKRIK